MPFPGASRTEHIELLDAHNDNEASETVTHTMERASESSPLSESRRVQNGEDDADVSVAKHTRRLLFNLGASFFLFGLINNVLYVIILSAALDLVPPSTPKGIIAFCNIAPALVAKVGWPYILKGRIRYMKRMIGCCLLSSFGMIVVAAFDSLEMRLLGISLASFSSGLGELTFLQLSTTYHPRPVAGHSVGYFASGTGAAGLVGAFAWWELRSLGVRVGVGVSSILPFIIPLTYSFLLPSPTQFDSVANASADYAPLLLNADVDDTRPEAGINEYAVPSKGTTVSLSIDDKWRLVKPLLMKYMLPLFCVYTFEYTINQGIAPTLLYPVPDTSEHPILHLIIRSIRDYYPLWQLVYQSTVFLSRSSISFGLPAIPERLLPMPAVVQLFILIALAFESGVGLIPANNEGAAIMFVFFMISVEGICGGLAYVNVFYRLNQEYAPSTPRPHDTEDPTFDDGADDALERERLKQEREFKIGSIGFADSSGILLASILAVPTEVMLCRAQVARGKTLCSGL